MKKSRKKLRNKERIYGRRMNGKRKQAVLKKKITQKKKFKKILRGVERRMEKKLRRLGRKKRNWKRE